MKEVSPGELLKAGIGFMTLLKSKPLLSSLPSLVHGFYPYGHLIVREGFRSAKDSLHIPSRK